MATLVRKRPLNGEGPDDKFDARPKLGEIVPFGSNHAVLFSKDRYGASTHVAAIFTRDRAKEAELGKGRSGPDLAGATGRDMMRAGTLLARIPVDSKGDIPTNVAVARLLDEGVGDRKGRKRNAFVDLAVLADTVAPEKAKSAKGRLEQYSWYLHPNASDLNKIDTPNADWVDRSTSQTTALIIKGSAAERKAVLKIVNDNFSNSEKKAMRGLTIEMKGNLGRGAAGLYRMAQGKGPEHDLIQIGKPYLFKAPDKKGPNEGVTVDDVTLTHELVHFLRARDPKRDDPIVKRPASRLSLRDRDLEESFTDSEALIRHTNTLTRQTAGYHHFLKEEQEAGKAAGKDAPKTQVEYIIYDKALMVGQKKKADGKFIPVAPAKSLEGAIRHESEFGMSLFPGDTKARELGFKDDAHRKLVTQRMFKHKKGANAYRAVAKNYPNLTLSQLKHDGPVEAIDTYWTYQAQIQGKPVTFNTQIYSPKATITPNTAIDLAVPDKPAKNPRLVEWEDGKRVKVRIPKAELPPQPKPKGRLKP